MLVKNGKEYYPLDIIKMEKSGKTYYSRHFRDKPYFYLVLRTQEQEQESISTNP